MSRATADRLAELAAIGPSVALTRESAAELRALAEECQEARAIRVSLAAWATQLRSDGRVGSFIAAELERRIADAERTGQSGIASGTDGYPVAP